MAPHLGLTSLTPLPKSIQLPQTQSTFNNNNKSQMSADDDDDSWEVRAFEEDTTGNLLGCTWPPRSYTCSFCRREFRSAQALGGHMNVHRRDRARMHETPPLPPSPPPPILIQTNGLCLLYPLPNPNSFIFPNPPPIDYTSPISHFLTNKPTPTETAHNSVVSSVCHSTNTEPSNSNDHDNNNNNNNNNKYSSIQALDENTRDSGGGEEELDLELRLGRRPPPPLP